MVYNRAEDLRAPSPHRARLPMAAETHLFGFLCHANNVQTTHGKFMYSTGPRAWYFQYLFCVLGLGTLNIYFAVVEEVL